MFKNLFNLSVKRTGLNALGFFIVYVLIGGLLCGLICAGIAVVYCMCHAEQCAANGPEIGTQIGRFFGPFCALILTFILGAGLLTCKKLWKSIPAILLFIASLPLSLVLGCVASMSLLAIVSTFDNGGIAKLTQDEQNPPQE